jgi:calmodulin
MGSGGSIESLTQQAIDLDISGKDIDTPRGVSAKDEVRRLRALLMETSNKTIQAIARARFDELDTDNSGFLENEELGKVTDWVMLHFGSKLGTDPVAVRSRIMARLDANGDGKLDPAEFLDLFNIIVQRMTMMERARVKFAEFDADKSGFLEAKEIDEVITWTLQAFPSDSNVDTYRERLMKQIDRNGDGKLDMKEFLILFEDMLVRTELMGRARTKFEELDADKSGMLEKAELDKVADWVLEAYTEKSIEERSSFKATLLKRIDVNGDGKLSLQEFSVCFDEILQRMDLIARAKKEFERLDSDHSGFLEKNELAIVLAEWGKSIIDELKIDTTADIDELLSKVDVNGDGKLSLLEFVPLFDACIAKSGVWASTAM